MSKDKHSAGRIRLLLISRLALGASVSIDLNAKYALF